MLGQACLRATFCRYNHGTQLGAYTPEGEDGDNSIRGDDGGKPWLSVSSLFSCILLLRHFFHILHAGKLKLTDTKITGLFYLLSGTLKEFYHQHCARHNFKDFNPPNEDSTSGLRGETLHIHIPSLPNPGDDGSKAMSQNMRMERR